MFVHDSMLPMLTLCLSLKICCSPKIFPQVIVTTILEYLVPLHPRWVVDPNSAYLDGLSPYAHQRSALKRKKRFQADPELAQKHRKVRHVQANPVQAKAWVSLKVTCACGAFDKGGICRCGPHASVVTPEYERQDEFFPLTTFARLARTKVALR